MLFAIALPRRNDPNIRSLEIMDVPEEPLRNLVSGLAEIRSLSMALRKLQSWWVYMIFGSVIDLL